MLSLYQNSPSDEDPQAEKLHIQDGLMKHIKNHTLMTTPVMQIREGGRVRERVREREREYKRGRETEREREERERRRNKNPKNRPLSRLACRHLRQTSSCTQHESTDVLDKEHKLNPALKILQPQVVLVCSHLEHRRNDLIMLYFGWPTHPVSGVMMMMTDDLHVLTRF